MCIIVAKPAGIAMPDYETLERCHQSNPDGSGFMWADGKAVHIRKGFMTFAKFAEALEAEGLDPVETPIVMHFRIATHGKVKPGCCHPFPVVAEREMLKATSAECRWGVAHNGVIRGRDTSDDWSDTMDFVQGVMAPLARLVPSFMYNTDAQELLESMCGSKLAIMDGSGEIVTVGQFHDQDGVKYSNTSYTRKVWSWSTYEDVWSGYESVYAKYYGGFGDVDELVGQLPYSACQECPIQRECAIDFPYCGSEREAEEVCLDELAVAECGQTTMLL